ncbi:hypothetical protein MMC28_008439 [Mycoblastus sanguinarius]|nr:hypothetical protein [Mycoblastus sanguinarius]
MSYEFLMHALLAIAAVHLMKNNSTQSLVYERSALLHQNLALKSSIPLIQEITPDNCHAFFAFAGMIALLAFAFPHIPDASAPQESVDAILGSFDLIRGIKTVLESAKDCIVHGSLGPLLNHKYFSPRRPLSADAKLAFEGLVEWNERETQDLRAQTTYSSAIYDLRRAFETYDVILKERSLVLVWATVVSDSYVMELKTRQPLAMVILAHFAVLLHSVSDRWWFEGKGSRLIEAISQLLPSKWQPAIQWPKDAIQKKGQFFLDID